MKLSGKDGSRIAILAGLAASEFYFIYRFFQQRDFELFLFASFAIVLLFATFYRIEWLVRRRVNNFHVCMVIGAGAGALTYWHKGNRILSVGIAAAGIFFSMVLLRRLLRPLNQDQQEANLSAYRAEANSLDPVTRDALSLLSAMALGAFFWAHNGFSVAPSASVWLILPLWYAGKLIYRALGEKKKSGNESAPIGPAS
ncbi:MAG: hypothetical protein WBQ94_16885 [Terracidiphilus sp.]